MPKLPRVKAFDVIRALEKMGFSHTRQKGSHVMLKKQITPTENDEQRTIEVGCVVPLHRKDLAIGTLSSILKQAGISVDEFVQYL